MKSNANLKTFNELFTNYQQQFIRFAESYVHDIAVAEDIVIDAFMYYWENKERLDENTNIPAYTLTTIKHKCLNHLEHLLVKKATSEKIIIHAEWELQTRISTLEAFDPQEIFTQEIQEIVNKTLASLPLQTQRIFTMSRDEHLSHIEIAQQLGITTKGVEFQISKALKVLRHSLKDYLSVSVFLLNILYK